MPETFGGGVPFAPRDGRPLGLGRFTITAGTTHDHGPFPSEGTAVLTSMDIVSAGGGSGGLVNFDLVNFTTVTFMSINVGSNTDAFSWRGAIPLIDTDVWRCVNVSDTDLQVVLSGMWVPQPYFAV